MIYYKIVDKKDDKIKILFHGINGSKFLEKGKWLKAEIKPVTDGDPKTSTTYMSGWHLFKTREEAEKYKKAFKNIESKIIIECKAKNLWRKEHSRANVWLAEYIYIIS